MNRRPVFGFILPLLVVCAGIVLLLNTLGLVAWDVWGEISRFWPVLLIAVGLNALVRHARNR